MRRCYSLRGPRLQDELQAQQNAGWCASNNPTRCQAHVRLLLLLLLHKRAVRSPMCVVQQNLRLHCHWLNAWREICLHDTCRHGYEHRDSQFIGTTALPRHPSDNTMNLSNEPRFAVKLRHKYRQSFIYCKHGSWRATALFAPCVHTAARGAHTAFHADV